eukprot:TRINITY_DN3031_c0_g1_i3.p2 TRINITY_DN3031_c0_g1~~TRINITY_DN3031_c0_g1_i3.p2  ORF type:complete len:358 (-),score=44.42 TRINITY_DN3031_c0_g1_i3:45-1118(-)
MFVQTVRRRQNQDQKQSKDLTKIKESLVLLLLLEVVVLDLILLALIVLFSMILIGIQLWINKHKIDAIEQDKQKMSKFTVQLLNIQLRRIFCQKAWKKRNLLRVLWRKENLIMIIIRNQMLRICLVNQLCLDLGRLILVQLQNYYYYINFCFKFLKIQNMKQFQQALHTVEDRDDIIAGEQLHLEQKDLIQQDQLDNSTNFNNGIDWEKLPTIYAYGKSFVFNEYYEQYGIEKPITQQEQIFVREPLIFQEKDKESNESSDEIDQESEMAEEMDEIQENEKEENEEENAGSNIQKTEKSEQEKEESQEEENFGDQKNIRIFSRQEILQYYKLYQQMQKSVQSAYQFQEQQAAFKVQE